MKVHAWSLAATAVLLAACGLGCSVSAGPGLIGTVASGTNLQGDADDFQLGAAMRGSLHSRKRYPATVAMESQLANPKDATSRVAVMAGASWLPLERHDVGFEVLAGLTGGSIVIESEREYAGGVTTRAALPIRVGEEAFPCSKSPAAAATFLFVPELGVQSLAPLSGDDHALRTEGVFIVSVRAHGWSTLLPY